MIDAAGFAKAAQQIILPPPPPQVAGQYFEVPPPPPQTAPDVPVANGNFAAPQQGLNGAPPSKARRLGEVDANAISALAGSAAADADAEEMEEMMALQVEQQRIAAERHKLESERHQLKTQQQIALDQQNAAQNGTAAPPPPPIVPAMAMPAVPTMPAVPAMPQPIIETAMLPQASVFPQQAVGDGVSAQGTLLQQRAMHEGVMNPEKSQQTHAFMKEAREAMARPKAVSDSQRASPAVEKGMLLVKEASARTDPTGSRERIACSIQQIHANLPSEAPLNAPKPGPVESRLASWAKMQGAMARIGLQDRSVEYAIAFANLQDETLEATKRFNEAVQTMDQLMSSAHCDVMQQHLMAKMQLGQQAQQQSPSFSQGTTTAGNAVTPNAYPAGWGTGAASTPLVIMPPGPPPM